jgi:hypothetical protein
MTKLLLLVLEAIFVVEEIKGSKMMGTIIEIFFDCEN